MSSKPISNGRRHDRGEASGAMIELGISRFVALLVLFVLAALAAPVGAADWGAITPGTTTMDQVRAQYGGPTRATTQKADNYDTAQWVYEQAQAPTGMVRMTVDFGLLTEGTYRANIVRSFKLEPRPGVFTRQMIAAGWGEPTNVSPQGDMPPRIFYASGLFVIFDKDGLMAESMLFMPPQPLPAVAPPRR